MRNLFFSGKIFHHAKLVGKNEAVWSLHSHKYWTNCFIYYMYTWLETMNKRNEK